MEGKAALMAACESVKFSAEEIFYLIAFSRSILTLKRMKATASKMKFRPPDWLFVNTASDFILLLMMAAESFLKA